jgi:hypothetical protein
MLSIRWFAGGLVEHPFLVWMMAGVTVASCWALKPANHPVEVKA